MVALELLIAKQPTAGHLSHSISAVCAIGTGYVGFSGADIMRRLQHSRHLPRIEIGWRQGTRALLTAI